MQCMKIESSEKLRILDIQAEVFKKSKQRIEITEKEVNNLGGQTQVYSSVGRMFVLTNIPELGEDLKGKKEKFGTMITQCDQNKEFLLKKVKEQEDNLRELVQQRKDADSVNK